jgi:hypothetical protein
MKCFIASVFAFTVLIAVRLDGAKVGQSSSQMMMPMGAIAPLVIQSRDWDSFVTLVNESKNQAHVQLALNLRDGAPAGSQIIILPGHSSRSLPVASLLSFGGEDFIGSLTATVQEPNIAKNMAVAAQLTLVDKTGKSASVDEELEMPEKGPLKTAVTGSDTLLAIQNPGMEVASVTLTCVEHSGVLRSTLAVAPNAVRFVHGCTPTDPKGAAPVSPAASAVLNAAANAATSNEPRAFEVRSPSGITAFGLSYQASIRQTTAAIFVNQDDITSTSTVFAGIPIGSYDPLPGATFKPTLTIANFSRMARFATIKGSTGSGPPRVLISVPLKPFEVQELELPPLSTSESQLGTIIVDHDGVPGAVVTTLRDEDNVDQTALTPVPKFLHPAQNGGGHPWSLEPGATSALVVFNASDKPQTLNFNLGANGLVWKKTVTMQPNELLNLKIKDIIDEINAEPTRNSKITALRGEISWFTPSQADVFGRTLIARVDNSRRAIDSYSCGDYIVLCGVDVSPSPLNIDQGSNGYLSASAEYCTSYDSTDCSGDDYGPGSADYYWQSEDDNTTPISGASDEESVDLYGAAVGSGGADVSASSGSCETTGGGGANVLGPDHVMVISDTNSVSSCSPNCYGSVTRLISFQVVFADNNSDKNTVPVQETLANVSTNTCGTGQPVASGCGNASSGQFADYYATNYSSTTTPIPHCGYTENQTYQWCPASGPVTIAHLSNDAIYSDYITINGVKTPSKMAAGTMIH